MKTISFFLVVAAFVSLTLSAPIMALPQSDLPEVMPNALPENPQEALPDAPQETQSEALQEALPEMPQVETLPEVTQEVIPEAVAAPPIIEDKWPEAITQKSSLEKHVVGSVSYYSGGVGQDEASEMKQLAKNYPLEIVFVQKDTPKESYIAAVKLQISDAKKNIVLDITTDGPIFLADLPAGKYLITAEFEQMVKINNVKINAKKHQRIVFLWPMQ